MSSARWDSLRDRGKGLATRAEAVWDERRRRHTPLDVAGTFYERDVDADGSVLGSAIALRLFLFVIPANVAIAGLVGVLRLGAVLDDHLEASVTRGSIAATLSGLSWAHSCWIFVSGLALTLWSGRSLARVLATCSAAAWRLGPRRSKVSVWSIVGLSAVLFGTIVADSLFARLRDLGGFPTALAAWSAVIATMTVAWFAVMLALPRGTVDPGALLPGACFVGICYSGLEWFMQYYLPKRIERTSDTLGDLATTVATLGNFFFIGRIMASGFIVTAVTYERFGSLSQLVFDLPVLRALPRRSARFAAFFDLARAAPDGTDDASDAASG